MFAEPNCVGEPIAIPEAPSFDDASRERGKALYAQFQCVICHGPEGKGDGVAAAALLDTTQRPIRPADFTRGFVKGGRGPRVVFRAISTGLTGTPMPSFAAMTDEAQRWDLAAYVMSLGADVGSASQYLFADPAGRISVP